MLLDPDFDEVSPLDIPPVRLPNSNDEEA